MICSVDVFCCQWSRWQEKNTEQLKVNDGSSGVLIYLLIYCYYYFYYWFFVPISGRDSVFCHPSAVVLVRRVEDGLRGRPWITSAEAREPLQLVNGREIKVNKSSSQVHFVVDGCEPRCFRSSWLILRLVFCLNRRGLPGLRGGGRGAGGQTEGQKRQTK